MSRAELDRLVADLHKHPHLATKLRSLGADQAVLWSRENGYDLTPEEIQELRDTDQVLSDEDLEEVAGGDWTPGGTGTSTGGTGTGGTGTGGTGTGGTGTGGGTGTP